jgi:hypothetical protein
MRRWDAFWFAIVNGLEEIRLLGLGGVTTQSLGRTARAGEMTVVSAGLPDWAGRPPGTIVA